MARRNSGGGRVTPKAERETEFVVDDGPPSLRQRSPWRFWVVIFIALLLVLSLVGSLF